MTIINLPDFTKELKVPVTIPIYRGRKKIGIVCGSKLSLDNRKVTFIPEFNAKYTRKFKKGKVVAKFNAHFESNVLTKFSVQIFTNI